MKNAVLLAIVLSVCFTGVASGAPKKSAKSALDREVEQLAKEVAAKLVSRAGEEVSITAHNCNLHIEYIAVKAAFDLPLAGTKIVSTEDEDGIILNNNAMKRTIQGRAPESFRSLILHFNHIDLDPMIKNFERVVASCASGAAR